MSFVDTVLADTVGVVWSAASGTVDPWTKQELQDQESAGLQNAGVPQAQADAQAASDVTTSLQKAFPNSAQPSADPSAFSAGAASTWSKISSAASSIVPSTKGLLIVVAIAAVALWLLLGRVKSTAAA